jgi:hypothetical protein
MNIIEPKLPLAEIMAGTDERLPQRDRERQAVNYIRHNLTDYDELVAECGDPAEKTRTRNRILRQIAEAYPELAEAAKRQMVSDIGGWW